jgi:hypothetical protein
VLHVASDSIITTGPRPAPGPWSHAYEQGAAETLCGQPLNHLHWEEFLPWPYRAVYAQMRCGLCEALVDA